MHKSQDLYNLIWVKYHISAIAKWICNTILNHGLGPLSWLIHTESYLYYHQVKIQVTG